ncbi:hypothetical protein DM02DRAFT_732031 [Periconia macrospinosa]|uniref:Uncharacterized protein n=1 Tax=Periconia macrospinosa TaxID=97972 RepID=A0A2V1DAI9_9PLEO|nr:hypothetical protein DM02DRAFT_732031 [Periconia macrospinosa]
MPRTVSTVRRRNRSELAAIQRAATCLHWGSTLTNRMSILTSGPKRFRILELTAEGLEKAIVNIKDAQSALTERRDKHWRRYGEYESEDEGEAVETSYCDQTLQIIMMADRERIAQFIKTHTRESDVSVEERMDLDATGADFDVLEEYLDAKIARAQMRLTDVHKTFLSEFETSVKADSLPFFTQLHSAIRTYLPTELRDMIYAYLLPIDKYKTGDYVHFHLPSFDPDFHVNTELPRYDFLSCRLESEAETTTKSFRAGTEDVHKPGTWLLNPSYVGKDMARDLAEIYYSSYGFGLQIENMKSFLHDDRTETGFKPLQHIQKKLDIYVQTTMCNGQLEGAWASTDNETEFLNRIYTTLRDLLLLSHIRKIPITIRIGTCSPLGEPQIEGDRRFYNVMEAVREPIYDLLHAGINLEVLHVAMASHNSQVISKEPCNFFRVSKESWQEERQTHSSSWRPSSNYVTREDCQQDRLQKLLVQRWGFTESIDSYGS